MPIFEYHCETCNQDFECLVFGNERPDCPKCQSPKVCKLMSACAFVSRAAAVRPFPSPPAHPAAVARRPAVQAVATDGASVRIGTRGSKLALWQANFVKSILTEKFPCQAIELVVIKTLGDKILDVPLAKVGGKGLFVKEIEQACWIAGSMSRSTA